MDRQMTLAEFHHLAGKDKKKKPQKSNLWQEYGKYALKTHNRQFLKVFRQASYFWRSGQMGGQKSPSPLKNPQKLPITNAQFPETA
jgi:hypothetical protein